MNIYDFHKYQQGLSAEKKKGMLTLTNILNDYLDKENTRDEEDIDYLNIINDIMIGPMQKHGLEWSDVLYILDDWNHSVGTTYVEDSFHYIDKDLFRDTLKKYWGTEI